MFTNKYLKPGFILLVLAIFVLVLNTPIYKAESNGPSTDEEIVLKVNGLTCAGCEGVKGAEVSYKEGKAVVKVEEGKVNTKDLIKAVEKSGFTASEG